MDDRLGVLAFGDSITNGGGEIQWGVALQSWALWVSRGLGVPYTPNAVDGALATDVTGLQIPYFRQRSAKPAARYDLGCLYVGVNDVRQLEWDPARFAHHHAEALDFLTSRCDRVVTLNIPLDMGRPRNPARITQANDAIELSARESGALLVDLRDWGARNLVMTDHVHPTAFGQIDIAERVLAALEQEGADIRVWPRQLILFETRRWHRLKGDWTYAYRHAKVSARARWIELTARG